MEKNKNKVPSGSGSMTCDNINSKIVNPDGGSQQVYPFPSLFADRNLVTERKLPEPWGLLLYLSWFQLDFNDYNIKDKEE